MKVQWKELTSVGLPTILLLSSCQWNYAPTWTLIPDNTRVSFSLSPEEVLGAIPECFKEKQKAWGDVCKWLLLCFL